MDFWSAIQTCFRSYATFHGRARRSEFWFFWLFLILGGVVGTVIDAALGFDVTEGEGLVSPLFSLATFIPFIAVTCRRLHDTNRSGWWQLAPAAAAIPVGALTAFASSVAGVMLLLVLAGLVSLGVAILVLVWLISRGSLGANRFGEDPLGPPVLVQPYAPPR